MRYVRLVSVKDVHGYLSLNSGNRLCPWTSVADYLFKKKRKDFTVTDFSTLSFLSSLLYSFMSRFILNLNEYSVRIQNISTANLRECIHCAKDSPEWN